MITEYTETTYTTGSAPYTTVTTKHTSGTTGDTHKGSPPVRKKVVRTKVDTSKFLTPYLDHSSKMQKLFSDVSQQLFAGLQLQNNLALVGWLGLNYVCVAS